MIQFNKTALGFKSTFEITKLLGLFLALSFVALYAFPLIQLYKPYTFFLVPLLTLAIGFYFFKNLAKLITYGDVNQSLNSEDYKILNAVMETNHEVNEYVSKKIEHDIKLTKRDLYYLNVSEFHSNMKKNYFKDEINKYAQSVPNQISLVSGVLKDLSIVQPLSFEEDKKKSKRKKIISASFAILFFALLVFMAYMLQFYNVDVRFNFFPVVTICLLFLIISLASIFFTHKELIDEKLLDEAYYEKVHQLSVVDINIVEYLKEIKKQGRLLYAFDYQAMSVEKRFQILQDVKYATLWSGKE